MTILAQTETKINLTRADTLIIRAYDRQGEWFLEMTFTGGVKVITPATEDEVNAIESELADTEGWRVNPSLYNNGFSARPNSDRAGRLEVPQGDAKRYEADDYIPFRGEPCYEAAI